MYYTAPKRKLIMVGKTESRAEWKERLSSKFGHAFQATKLEDVHARLEQVRHERVMHNLHAARGKLRRLNNDFILYGHPIKRNIELYRTPGV